MAKTRPAGSKKGKKSKGSSRSGASASPAASQPRKSPRTYVEEAETAMTQGDVDVALTAALKAQKTLESARSGTSNNIVVDGVGLAAVYSLVGEIHLENGDVAEARASLMRAVELDTDGTLPDTLGGGVDKYLYLAQLSEEGGRDSLRWFQQGVEGLRARAGQLHKEIEHERRRNTSRKITKTASSMNDKDAEDDDDEDDDEYVDEATIELTIINGKLAQILCAMAEVWMTDLSFEDDCEQQCEQLTTEATMVEPRSSEAWQTLANVRISQSRDEEARAALQRSLDLWEALPADHPAIPAFSVRVSLARLLMTVGWLAKAIDVTTQLLRDDEQSVEVWYLAGYANYLLGQEQKEEEVAKEAQKPQEKWRTTWTEARRCLGRCLRRFHQQQYEDERLGEHANELMQELVAAVGEPSQKELDEEDYEEEDEWEDDEDDEGEDEDENEDEDEEMKD